MEVDTQRKRIALSMRLDDKPEQQKPRKRNDKPVSGKATKQPTDGRPSNKPSPQGTFAQLFADAGKIKNK